MSSPNKRSQKRFRSNFVGGDKVDVSNGHSSDNSAGWRWTRWSGGVQTLGLPGKMLEHSVQGIGIKGVDLKGELVSAQNTARGRCGHARR